jgi:phosphoribosylamine--glycine ligase
VNGAALSPGISSATSLETPSSSGEELAMNVLLLGSGGREHALAWRLAQSPLLDTLYAAPGNPGIAEHAEIVDLDPADHRGVIDFCLRHSVTFVVIGPEAPLVDGLADNIRTMGIGVFGPGREAARLEGSKGFTKDLCARANIPTARYARVTSRDGARAALDEFALPVVIKDDGLAAGKGVTIATTREEAEAAIDAIVGPGRVGGDAVIEEFLDGEEASLFVLTDGTAIVPFGSAQDHKRVGDGDTGPNTGGMGAYSPASVLTPELERRALDEIVRPTVAALAKAGTPFSGVLYAGLMLTAEGPKLIEYNVRFGDPECQVLMMRFEGDLLALMLAAEAGKLGDEAPPRFADETALVVVMAANGYPGTPETGGAIAGLDKAEAAGARVFQAGTKLDDGKLVAAGGRVLGVAATGADVAAAQKAAYRGVDAIDFPTGFCRRDIGWREIERG